MILEGNALIQVFVMRLKGQCEFKVGYKHSAIFIPYFTSPIHKKGKAVPLHARGAQRVPGS
jgi:hypothetical protein